VIYRGLKHHVTNTFHPKQLDLR